MKMNLIFTNNLLLFDTFNIDESEPNGIAATNINLELLWLPINKAYGGKKLTLPKNLSISMALLSIANK